MPPGEAKYGRVATFVSVSIYLTFYPPPFGTFKKVQAPFHLFVLVLKGMKFNTGIEQWFGYLGKIVLLCCFGKNVGKLTGGSCVRNPLTNIRIPRVFDGRPVGRSQQKVKSVKVGGRRSDKAGSVGWRCKGTWRFRALVVGFVESVRFSFFLVVFGIKFVF